MSLRAYMVFDRGAGPEEGACLVFAHTSAEAKRIGWREVEGWLGSEWTEVGVRWMRRDTEWLAEQEGVDLEGEPVLVDSPKACSECDMWGRSPLNDKGRCELCDPWEGIEE